MEAATPAHPDKLVHSESADTTVELDNQNDYIDRDEDISSYSLEERHLFLKLTRYLVPWMFVMYFFCYIDRANLSSALVMNKETGHSLKQMVLSDQDVSIGLGLFYLGYVIFEIPSNWVLTKVRPSLWFARIMVSWGIVLGCFALISKSWHFFLLRFLLGATEAGLFPGMSYYMTLWFKRRETSTAYSGWYIGLPLAGMVSGILGAVIGNMDGIGNLRGWQWNFLLPAIPTILIGIAAYFILPDEPSPTSSSLRYRFLSTEEHKMAESRMATRKAQLLSATHNAHSLRTLWRSISDWKVIFFAIVYLPGLVASTSLAYYLPLFVSGLGFSSVLSQIMAAAGWIYAAIHMVIAGRISDKFGSRSLPLVVNMILASIGFLGMGLGGNLWVLRYVAAFLALGGTKSVTAICMPWTSNNFVAQFAPGAIAAVTTLGNIGNIVTSFTIFSAWAADAQRNYEYSCVVVAGLMWLSILSTVFLRVFFIRENGKPKGAKTAEAVERYII
ncbi:major facilitator superfamily domain-containing protein [Polychytrium aggregatum]|uniref:major facilitator superfamily domain-containing protein n=1 Tax=Polychytrium aggregatum TaxID=110093 RepID=UPI0022FF1D1B|nr:major facilitator superfamily domain-containing protein [Polychytrium aggregatum]KAI9204743.1 major facilitator superfamily domain-containing protein [Polychytrium aggregatum]